MKRSIFGGMATLAALTLLGSATAPTASASMARDRTGGDHCAASANGKVMKGTKIWSDPETLTRKQAARMEVRNHRVLRRSGIHPTARPNGSVKISVHFHGVTDRAGHGFVTK